MTKPLDLDAIERGAKLFHLPLAVVVQLIAAARRLEELGRDIAPDGVPWESDVERVARFLNDLEQKAEQRAAESLAASQPRQGGADGREVWVVESPHDGITGYAKTREGAERARAAKNETITRYVPAESRQQPLEWHATLQENIRAAAKCVLMACGVEDNAEAEAEQLRLAALRCRDLGHALRKAVDAFESRQQQESGWVLCSERMPEPDPEGTLLMLFVSTEVLTGAWDGDDWLHGDRTIARRHITHWMAIPPLPPPPAERPAKETSNG